MRPIDQDIRETTAWFDSPRFKGIVRLHTAQQVVEQRGTIAIDYTVARGAAEQFYARLRELFERRRAITTFGPYSPGQAVVMKRHGIEGIYLGGWATSAKGGVTEDPGADLASYPLSQVPDEAAAIVRALLAADRNQRFLRARLDPSVLGATTEVDYRPFIIADADTGHGGDAHVRNLIRRFVEAGVPGYHIEDQKPGVKKCGHQGGKVLVAQNEQILRLNAARLQLDVMQVPGIIVARTDAEAATLLDSNTDERDQPFILGVTDADVPSYRAVVIALHRLVFEAGIEAVRGHLMYSLPATEHERADDWLARGGIPELVRRAADPASRDERQVERLLDDLTARCLERWQREAGVKTYREAVSAAIADRLNERDPVDMTIAEWQAFAKSASLAAARSRAESLGLYLAWDAEQARTPEGYYQVQGGLEYAIAKSVAAAPFADLLWMETNTPNLEEARAFAESVHARFPDKMLAYNLSPSFNWDATGMSEGDMRRFPAELGKLGFVFTFITYGGHQIDGLAAEDFCTSLRQDGMLALARVQRRFRLIGSPYRTPQALVGGSRLDAALMAASGRTATTKAMGKGSTHHQHLREVEPSPELLERWLLDAGDADGRSSFRAHLEPLAGSTHEFELRIHDVRASRSATIAFAVIRNRDAAAVLSVAGHGGTGADVSNRAVLLGYQFLLHRFKPAAVQWLAPTDPEWAHASALERLGLVERLHGEAGRVLVGDVNAARVRELSQSQSHVSMMEQASSSCGAGSMRAG